MSHDYERMPIIRPSEDLVCDAEDFVPETNHVLLNIVEPTEDIDLVKTEARILKRDDLPNALTISSQVESISGLSYAQVAERFVDIHPFHASYLHPTEVKPGSDLGQVILSSSYGHNATINPDYTNDSWSIQSIMDGFHEHAEDPDVIAKFFSGHAVVLNGLVAAIEGREYPRISDYPDEENAYLEMRVQDEVTETLPDPFDKFVGIDQEIEELKQVVKLANIDPEFRNEHDIDLIQSVLLSGPSGLGKTELARSLADALGAEIQEVELEDIASAYVSQWATNIAAQFDEAMETPHRVLLFFDEVDGLLSAANQDIQRNINSIIKKKLETIRNYPNVFVVMATNDEAALPPEIRAKKRIPMNIRLHMPSESERKSILKKLLVEAPLASSSMWSSQQLDLMQAETQYDYDKLCKETEDMSPGEIEAAIRSIKQRRIKEDVDLTAISSPLTHDEVFTALRYVRRTREA